MVCKTLLFGLSTLTTVYTLNLYDQCGGINYSGSTTCPSGSHCEVLNPYYYQCLPGSASPASSTTPPGNSPPGSSPPGNSPPSSGGFSGSGVTTRYWDCCKPSCSWNGKSSHVTQPVATCDASGNTLTDVNVQSGCNGGSAYMCSDQTPWAVNNSLSYGFAAASLVGGSEDSTCCTCMKLTFTSGPVSGNQMIVQVTNTGSDLSSNHFDIAIPGGGFGIFTQGCPGQFGSGYQWGAQYGGISSASECAGLPQVLQAGCYWRFNWFQNADNPSVNFEQVTCPQEITAKTGCVRTD